MNKIDNLLIFLNSIFHHHHLHSSTFFTYSRIQAIRLSKSAIIICTVASATNVLMIHPSNYSIPLQPCNIPNHTLQPNIKNNYAHLSTPFGRQLHLIQSYTIPEPLDFPPSPNFSLVGDVIAVYPFFMLNIKKIVLKDIDFLQFYLLENLKSICLKISGSPRRFSWEV